MLNTPTKATRKKAGASIGIKIKLKISTKNSEVTRGRKNCDKRLILASVTFISLLRFKIQVKAFEKYIIPINPRSPVTGNKSAIKSMRSEESHILFLKQKFCWSRPFKIPSQILSKYINGTIGANAQIKKPTSVSL